MKQRRLVLSAGTIACHGRVQREDEVIMTGTHVLPVLITGATGRVGRHGPAPVEDYRALAAVLL